jgi:hypothetical protein
LYTGKCHSADMARPADFVQCPAAPRAGTCSTSNKPILKAMLAREQIIVGRKSGTIFLRLI